MPVVTRRPDMETKKNPYVAEYACKCGRPLRIFAEAKLDRLAVCWECCVPMYEIVGTEIKKTQKI